MDNSNVAVITRDTYSYNNNTVFFSLINEVFYDYYNRIVLKAQQWLDGYDPTFHRDDMVSTRIASKLMYGFAKSILGRGLVFEKGKIYNDAKNETLDFVNKWADDGALQDSMLRTIVYTLSLGTSALKVNRSANGDLWVEPLRMDNFYYCVDGKKHLTSFTNFIRCFTSSDNNKENYFLVEKRYFKYVKDKFTETINGKKYTFDKGKYAPYVEYKVFKYNGSVMNNTMPSRISDKTSVNYKLLPDYVKKGLKEDYSAFMIDEPMLLPFVDWLGIELLFNESGDATNPTLPVGRSYVFDCLADFMHYDMNKSYALRDLYNSKGIVGIPKSLSQSDLVDASQGQLKPISPYSNLNISGYEIVNGLDPDKQSPIITQFEIREQEHQMVVDDILKSIATTIGVSPRLLASYIAQGGTKTDDEVQSEDDSITQWVKSQRQTYLTALNHLVEQILNYNGFASNISVKFASDGLRKEDRQLDSIERRLNMGLLDIEDAIREYYPDLDENQLQIKINKAKQQQQLKAQQQQAQYDFDFENEQE